MGKRPAIPARVMVDVAIRQAPYSSIRCPICRYSLEAEQKRILEHLVPHALGGSSEAENLRWVHKDCAAKKTNGNKATSADGDIHKVAKSKRLALAQTIHQQVIAGEIARPKSRIPSRPFQRKAP